MSPSAILLATAEAAEGGAAALLGACGSTLLARLLGQLASLGVAPVTVITRPEWEDAVRAEAGDAAVLVSADAAGDLRAIADFPARGGPLLLACADVLVHREALAGLLADPRIATGVLVSVSPLRGGLAFRTRAARGRVVAAESAYHRVTAPSGYFLGVVKVDRADRRALAAGATALARLADPVARPPEWDAELERKAAEWRVEAWRRRLAAETGEPAPYPEAVDPAALELDADAGAELAARVAAAREDAVALALVGLVRSGAHVGQSHLRAFFWARVLSGPAARRAEAALAGFDEDRIALASAVKSTDGFFTTFFVSPYSRYIARFAARRGWTPNAMTTVSMAIGAVAAGAFALGSRASMIVGAILLQAAFTVDCVDGQLARYTRTFSKLGAWLDSVFDRGKEYLVYAGLAVGASRGFGQHVWTLAGAALTLQTVRHMIDFSFTATRHQAIAAAPLLALHEVEDRPVAPRAAQPPAEPSAPAGGTAVATVARPAPVAAPAPARPGLAARAVSLIGRLDRVPGILWAKRILVLPIGERFALISITAALGSPRLTFTALLVWGGIAALYAVPGRILRSVAR
jgi:phosphatidylglycerophosphate synthase